jgi:hypothetical protein
MQSKFIAIRFYNSYAERYFQSVDKIDDYTLRIVGTRGRAGGHSWITPAYGPRRHMLPNSTRIG